MGLDSAFVDRARVVRQEAVVGERVRGMTVMAPTQSAWFAALLQLPAGTELSDASQGRRRVVQTPTLMLDVFDEENEKVSVQAGDKVEVDSVRFGVSMWEVSGDPMPVASLSDVFGYTVQVRRIADHEFRPVGA